ncbi:(2Fe-2S)-binding protein [Hoeflea sp. TYP-13]|uniref:(2Fe-2S)-binding protein n=1 Tax=Hoeflea sp. TYP-13 TaxID=3230023 RepID=UPI0034C64126
MFKRLSDHGAKTVRFTFDGQTVSAREGDTVAAALFAAGYASIRKTPVHLSERGPFCMMGACYDCLVEIDGITVQACMTPVRPGLVVNRAAPAHTFSGDAG